MHTARHLPVTKTALIFFLLTSTTFSQDQGVVAGWNPNDGRVLLNELKCIACHKAETSVSTVSAKQAPNLAQVGSRVTPQYLKAFLAEPHTLKAGTTMPDLLQGLKKEQQVEVVDALTHYLASLGGPMDQRKSGASLGEIARGRELYHTIGCVSCHQPFDPAPKHKIDANGRKSPKDKAPPKVKSERPPVPLPPLAMKTTVDDLAKFLHNPLEIRPSGRMPSLSLEPGEGRSIAAYLLREQFTKDQTAPGSGVAFALYQGNFPKAADVRKAKPIYEAKLPEINLQKALAEAGAKIGKRINSNFGARFHGLLEVPTDGEYRFWTRSDDGSVLWINGKVVVNNDGHHPPKEADGKVTLRRGRHKFDLIFTQGGGGFELAVQWQTPGSKTLKPIESGVLLNEAAAMIPKGIAKFTIDNDKVNRGKKFFVDLRCASCHKTNEEFTNVKTAMPLMRLNVTAKQGCISEKVADGLPVYDLSDKQRIALREALAQVQKGTKPGTPEEQVQFAMTTMNCYSCHQRGKIGGPDAAKTDYFVYETVVDLGEEGRMPPPLHEVGAKLTEKGFDDMLFAGQKYRTYAATRMPQFGKDNVGHFPALFEKADAGKVPERKPEFSSELVDVGRFLMGGKALACINCHAWGDYRLPGAEGMDFLDSTRRLKPGWFHAWLKNPQAMRPGTRMPTSWPMGKTFFPKLAGGDVDRQIDAIWAYLSVGQKGGFPPGLSPKDDTLLRPNDQTIVFRTFLDKVSAHAILVGFRQRTHLAFDANRVRSVLAWTGPFISTSHAWSGRAGQYAKIESKDIVMLPEGPPFAILESKAAPWPKDVPKGKDGSARTPDGWRFRGYRLGKDRIPTFLYDVENVRVEESPGTSFDKDSSVMTRKFVLTSLDQPKDLHFLVARGKTITEKDGVYEIDGKLRFRIEADPKAKPVIRDIEGGSELLVPVQFEKADKQHKASFTIEMKW